MMPQGQETHFSSFLLLSSPFLISWPDADQHCHQVCYCWCIVPVRVGRKNVTKELCQGTLNNCYIVFLNRTSTES